MRKHNTLLFAVLLFLSTAIGKASGALPQQQTNALPDFGTAAYYKREDVRQAATVYIQQKNALITQARIAFRQNDYQRSSHLYKQAYNLRLNLPDAPTSDTTTPLSRTMVEAGEWGDSLAAQGKLEEAIQAYRYVIYEESTPGSIGKSMDTPPLAPLPPGNQSVGEASPRYPNVKTINWVCNEPCVLARYALLLVEAHRYEEAIAAYDRAVKYLNDSPYQKALVLDNISAGNFDKRRFVAAAHTIVADKTGSAIEIYYGYYDHTEIRGVWENELRTAVEINPDFAPALVALADVLIKPGERPSQETRQLAKDCLSKAATNASDSAQKELVVKKSDELRRRL